VELSLVDDLRVGWPVTRIRLTTDAGTTEHEVERGEEPRQFAVAPGLTSTVRVTVLGVAAGRDNGNVGIAELSIPGVTPQRALRTPADATPAADQRTSFVFSRGSQPRYACVGGACDANLTRTGEEPDGVHRLFSTPVAANYELSGTVLPALGGTPPVALPGIEVTASSQLAGDPAASALSAVDGSPATAWRPDVRDLRPTLKLSWETPTALTGLRLTGADLPSDVEITVPKGSQTVPLRGGVARFDLTTTSIEIRLVGGGSDVRELRLSGLDLPLPPREFTVPCGEGPAVTLDGFTYDTSVSGMLADVVAHQPLRLRMCPDSAGGIDLLAGEHEVRTERSAAFVVQNLNVLPSKPTPTRESTRDVEVSTWDTTNREVRVGPGDEAVLSVPENANDGWVATLDGRTLDRIRVDGWQQAWLVPAGQGGTVELEFAPDTQYRTGLMLGGLAALALVGTLFIPARRRPVEVRAGGDRWVPVVLVVLLGVLGGMLPLVLLIACLLVRTLWAAAPRWLAVGGAALACLVAVSGRLLGNGQEWAYGTVSQGLLLLAVTAVVTGCVDWFAPGPQLDHGAGTHEQAGGDDRGGDDLGESAVEPGGDEPDLDRDGKPDQER
jgi:arabinofuranan 3-O-arabinosyltransferase